MKKIVLASQSPYRKQLLQRLGVDFTTTHPLVDEDEVKENISNPVELVQELSKLKARSVSKLFHDHLIIGSDQLVSFESKILGKPLTKENAFEQLRAMSGKTHSLLTSVTLINEKDEYTFLNETKLTMKHLSDSFIQEYIEKDRPLDCAGSYKIERAGISLFDSIDCADFTAITGLPLIELSKYLQENNLMKK